MVDPPVDIVTMLRRHVDLRPDAPCLTDGDERLTFHELEHRAVRVASALIGMQMPPGSRIALLTPACCAVYELLFGCAMAGMILVPLNWRLSPREIAQIIADADPALVIVHSSHSTLIAEAQASEIMILDEGYPTWRDSAGVAELPLLDPDVTALILYTSGTTGLPKGVMLSQRNLSYLGRMAGELWSYTPDSVNLIAMPLFHIGGIGWGLLGLSQGGASVIERRSDPAALLETMSRYGVTHAFFVPTVIQRLVDQVEASGGASPKIEHIFYGAAPIGEALLRRALATFGGRFHHVYGMTETAGTTVTLAPADHDPDGPHAARLRSCGKPMPWIELILVDPATGGICNAGEVGEIRVRSLVVTAGYWRNPAVTEAAITADGWLCSGDAAMRDADGYLYIQDRYKDMIVSGGENIYPTEIDNVLQHHPAVAEVAVVGVPHETWGETPRAYVVREAGQNPSEAELIAFTRERLARFKCPTSIMFVDALPRNASGKILKRDLRS